MKYQSPNTVPKRQDIFTCHNHKLFTMNNDEYVTYDESNHVLICRQHGYGIPNHYSTPERLVVPEILCGKLWVRFPTKKKTTTVSTHKIWSTTTVSKDIPIGKQLIGIDIRIK